MTADTNLNMDDLKKFETGYVVLTSDDLHELVRKVNEFMAASWHPTGRVLVTPETEFYYEKYYQAMVKP